MTVHVSRWLLALALALPLSNALAVVPGDELNPFPDYALIDGGVKERASAVAVQPDGRILLAGSMQVGDRLHAVITRMWPDGTVDTGFADGGVRRLSFGTGSLASAGWIGVLPDGRILVLGTVLDDITPSVSLLVVRLLPNGAPDTTYSTDGIARYGDDVGASCGMMFSSESYTFGCDAAWLPDGSLLIAAGSTPIVGRGKRLAAYALPMLYKLRPDATPDLTFGEQGGVLLRTLAGTGDDGPRLLAYHPGLAVRSDGRILVATGVETPASGAYGIALMQLRANGTPDTAFGSGGAVTIAPELGDSFLPFDVHVAPGGAITVGATASLNGSPAFVAARFRSNGTRDPGFASNGLAGATFDAGDEFEAPALATGMHIDSSGHVYITGTTGTSTLDGQDNTDFAMAAFTPQGLPDLVVGAGGRRIYSGDFSAGGGPFFVVRESALAVTSDALGRMVVVGGGDGPDDNDGMIVRRIHTRDMFRDSLEGEAGPSG